MIENKYDVKVSGEDDGGPKEMWNVGLEQKALTAEDVGVWRPFGHILVEIDIRGCNPNRKLVRVHDTLIRRIHRFSVRKRTATYQSPSAPSFESTDTSRGNGVAR